MNCEKYVGLEVHQATISVAVRDCKGKVVMESILETKASTTLEFFAGLRATLSVCLHLDSYVWDVRDRRFPKISMWLGSAEQLLSGIFRCCG